MQNSRLAAVSLFAIAALALGPISMSGIAPAHGCHQDLRTIPVGSGSLLASEDTLEGINHVDIAFPGCSPKGNFFFLDEASPSINYYKFCGLGFVRFYADEGAAAAKVAVGWSASSVCGGDLYGEHISGAPRNQALPDCLPRADASCSHPMV